MQQLKDELKSIRIRLMTEEKECVKDARFVATTVSKAVVDHTIFDSKFDVVIFDEASMAYIPQIISQQVLQKNILYAWEILDNYHQSFKVTKIQY